MMNFYPPRGLVLLFNRQYFFFFLHVEKKRHLCHSLNPHLSKCEVRTDKGQKQTSDFYIKAPTDQSALTRLSLKITNKKTSAIST